MKVFIVTKLKNGGFEHSECFERLEDAELYFVSEIKKNCQLISDDEIETYIRRRRFTDINGNGVFIADSNLKQDENKLEEKLYIKYIMHGTLEVEKPHSWEKIGAETKKYFIASSVRNTGTAELMRGIKIAKPEDVSIAAVVNPKDENSEYEISCSLWENYVFNPEISLKLYEEKQ